MPLSTRLRKLAEGVISYSTSHDEGTPDSRRSNSQVAASFVDILDTITQERRVKRSAAVPGGCPAGLLAHRLLVSTASEALRPMLYNSRSNTTELVPCLLWPANSASPTTSPWAGARWSASAGWSSWTTGYCVAARWARCSASPLAELS